MTCSGINTTYRSCYYLFIMEGEKFSITHKRPCFVCIFVYYIFVLFTMETEKFSVTHKRPCFVCIFVYCFFGKLLYFLPGNFRESFRHFFENKSKNVIVFSVVMVTLLYHPFLLLYHYYAEIVIISTNQISEISRLIL